jgi:hypothetical protein
MTLWTDLFASTRIGDIQFLSTDDYDPAIHKELTSQSQPLPASLYPDLAARFGSVPAVWDGAPLESFGAGYYSGATAANKFPIMEETPGGKMRLWHANGFFESNDRGLTWTNNIAAADPVKCPPYSATGVNGYPGGMIRRADGRLYSYFLADDFNGSGFNKKQVCYSDDFGTTWTGLFYEDGDSGSNTYNDMAWSPTLNMLAVIQYNGRIITHNGQSGTLTQRKGGNGGGAPYNYSIRWVQEFNGGNGMFVVASGDRVYTSNDGITWTERMMPAGCMVQGTSDFGPLGVVGYKREVTTVQTGGTTRPVRSLDGVTWTPIDLNIPYNGVVGGTLTLYGIWAYAGKYIIAYKHSLAPAGSQVRLAFTEDFVSYSSMRATSVDTHLLSMAAFFDDVAIITGPHSNNQNSYYYNYSAYQFYRYEGDRVVLPAVAEGITGTLKPYMRIA